MTPEEIKIKGHLKIQTYILREDIVSIKEEKDAITNKNKKKLLELKLWFKITFS